MVFLIELHIHGMYIKQTKTYIQSHSCAIYFFKSGDYKHNTLETQCNRNTIH